MPRQGGWVPAYSDITRNRKTRAAADALRISRHQLVGHLIAFWTWAREQKTPVPVGGPLYEEDIERAAEWTGKRGKFVEALEKAAATVSESGHGFLVRGDDGLLYIHDWTDGGGRGVKVSTDAGERRNRNRSRSGSRSNTDPDREQIATREDQRRSDPPPTPSAPRAAPAADIASPRRSPASPGEPESEGVAAYLAVHDRFLSTWGPRDDGQRLRVLDSPCAQRGCLLEHVQQAERSLSDRDTWPRPPRQPWSAFAKALDHAMASCDLGNAPDSAEGEHLESLPLPPDDELDYLRKTGQIAPIPSGVQRRRDV